MTAKYPRIAEIQQAVANHFGTPLIDMRSDRRSARLARPRQLAMYLARQLTPHSLPSIGRHFGNRDHTTVMHAVRVVEIRRSADIALGDAIDEIRARLRLDL